MVRKQLATKAAPKLGMDKPPPATKSTRSRYWFARVNGPKEFLKEKCKVLAEQLDVVSFLAAYHTGDTKEHPHTHFVIELNREPQKQSFAVQIKQLFSIEKRSDYSLDVWDGKRGAGACSYLFHEDDAEILFNKGHSDEDITTARSANDVVKRVIAVNKEKASNKFVDKALVKFEGEEPDERDLLEYMLELTRNGELYWPGTFRAKQLIEEVRIKMCGDLSLLAAQMYLKMFG